MTVKGTIRLAAGAADSVEAQASPAPPASQPGAQATQPDSQAIEQTYVYTIRRDGRVFVDIQAQVASPWYAPDSIGLGVTCLHTIVEPRQIDPLDRGLLAGRSARQGAATGPAPATAVAEPAQAMASARGSLPIPRAILLSRLRGKGASLLLVPSDVAPYDRAISVIRQTGDLEAHMYVMPAPKSDKIHLAAMLAIWPPDLRDMQTAAAVARDYQQPTPPIMEVGRLRKDTDGDLDGDGFAEARGCWAIQPDGQVVRLRWPAGQLRFWPMLEVTGIQGKSCWPYLDGRIIKPVEKRPDGSVLFVVPEILSRAALLEVTVEK